MAPARSVSVNIGLHERTNHRRCSLRAGHIRAGHNCSAVLRQDLVGTVAAEIAAISPLIGDPETIGLRSETSLVNFNMTAARDAAWFTAERLANEPAALHSVTIDGLDLAVSVEGRAILYPPVGGEGLQVIQQAEVKDVRRVIEVLSQGGAAASAQVAAS